MTTSHDLFVRAQELIPGGVNSPVRACHYVGAEPLFIRKAYGPYIESVDGQKLIDYVLSWGPMILGHTHPEVVAAVKAAVDLGSSYGAPCEAEVQLAEALVEALPSVDMVRMVSSGTEATMSALRLARGVTGRNKVIKFIGCYHGHADPFMAAAGSGVATLSIPGTPGVPPAVVEDTLLAPYNDLEAVADLFEQHGEDIAGVIVEPVAGNMGLVLPREGFLEGLRDLTLKYEALLIFDEVITGFRLGYSGAQGVYGIDPDLTCLGKIVGGGFPVGAYAGKRQYMERIAPKGNVYQAGTLSGNPVAMAAGLATLKLLKTSDYPGLARRTKSLAEELAAILKAKGVPMSLVQTASCFTLYFCPEAPHDFASAKLSDAALFGSFYRQMREAGVYLAPAGFEAAFTSFAHGQEDFEKTLEAAKKVKF